MGLVCIQNSSLLVYSKSQKVSASYCLAFQHSRGKNQPVGGFRPPGLFRVKTPGISDVDLITQMRIIMAAEDNRKSKIAAATTTPETVQVKSKQQVKGKL